MKIQRSSEFWGKSRVITTAQEKVWKDRFYFFFLSLPNSQETILSLCLSHCECIKRRCRKHGLHSHTQTAERKNIYDIYFIFKEEKSLQNQRLCLILRLKNTDKTKMKTTIQCSILLILICMGICTPAGKCATLCKASLQFFCFDVKWAKLWLKNTSLCIFCWVCILKPWKVVIIYIAAFFFFSVIINCRCLKTSNIVNPSLITDVTLIDSSSYCKRQQVM